MTHSQTKDEEKRSVVPVVTAALVGLAVGAAIGVVITTSAGDEAPIKVKNGSVDVEVLHTSQELEDENNDGKDWKFKGNVSHRSEEFEVYFASGSADCKLQMAAGKKVQVKTLADNGTVGQIDITSPGGKTKIKSREKLDRISGRLLKDQAAGVHVTSVDVYDSNPNQTPLCRVNKGDSLSVILVGR